MGTFFWLSHFCGEWIGPLFHESQIVVTLVILAGVVGMMAHVGWRTYRQSFVDQPDLDDDTIEVAAHGSPMVKTEADDESCQISALFNSAFFCRIKLRRLGAKAISMEIASWISLISTAGMPQAHSIARIRPRTVVSCRCGLLAPLWLLIRRRSAVARQCVAR